MVDKKDGDDVGVLEDVAKAQEELPDIDPDELFEEALS